MCAWYAHHQTASEDARRSVADKGTATVVIHPQRCVVARQRLVEKLLAVLDTYLASAQISHELHDAELLDLFAIDLVRSVLEAPCGWAIPADRAVPLNHNAPPQA